MSSTPGVSDGPTPAAHPPTDQPSTARPRRGLVVLAVVAVVAVVAGVVGVLVLGGGDDGLDVEPAADGLERMVDDPRFFSDGVLEECPLGDIGGVEAVVAEHGDGSSLATREQQSLNPHERMQAATVLCTSRSADDTARLEVFASRVPSGEYEDGLTIEYIGRDLDLDQRQLEGGDLYVYCSTNPAYVGGCGADWVHGDDLAVGIYGEGLGLDADGVAAVLEASLPDLLSSLAAAEAVYAE